MAAVPPPNQVADASDTTRLLTSVDQTVFDSLRAIFDAHAGPDRQWGSTQIKNFLETVQRHSPAETPSELLAKPTLDFNTFVLYMTSARVSIIKAPQQEDLDLSWPLASYFVSSSHNTYLTGNQLSSSSTTDAYASVLRRGCRCVEIDVWDGEESDSDTSSSDDSEAPRRQSSVRRIYNSKEKRKSTFNILKEKLSGGPSSPKKSQQGQSSPGKAVKPPSPPKSVSESAVAGNPKDSLGGISDKVEGVTLQDGPAAEVVAVEPRVLHGYTLTTDVSFRDVCVAIKDNAFAVTELPLIVSLEVHCSAQQQAVMVAIMTEIWGDFLVPEPEGEVTELPSPDKLRNKILIKVKWSPPDSSTPDEDSPDDDRAADAAPEKKKKKTAKIIRELSRLGVYTRAITFKSFSQPEASMPAHIFSLSEKKFLNHLEEKSTELFQHNKRFFVRAYPSGLRIGSSNLNPAVFWGAGAQIVALNWQQTDEGMMLNEGMFQKTEGYVLKPPGYRPDLESRKTPNAVIRKTLSLSLTFFAAQGIPVPPEDKSARSFKPYVKVELHVDASEVALGGPVKTDGHEREGDYKAKTKTQKGCNVDFNEQKIEFKKIPGLVEELTFVRFTVRDDEFGRDDLAAWACVRLDRLAEGYRLIPLIDTNGHATEGMILVRVEKTLV
ncbi:hypothetical protein S40288_01094 [Stachybotrys chartarum IBT 40288]|nr:hypothetical protein S40288_01094 [Stachybotrys chartarum IBT 40288]